MHKKKDERRDIYQGSSHDLEKDFTPQVVQEQLEMRQRELRQSRVASLFFGTIALILSMILIVIVIRDFMSTHKPADKTRIAEKPYTPGYSLPEESFWVMDYKQAAPPAESDAKPGSKPLSSSRVKAAAYHIIMGQQAMSINATDQALEHFQKVIEIYPDIKGLYLALGMLHLKREEYAVAAQQLEKAVQEEEVFDAVANLGAAYI